MRYCLFFLLFTAVLPTSAQIYVDKVDVNARPIQYVEVWEKFNKENGKFFAMLDYGQQDDFKDKAGKLLFVTNQEGQYLEFNSMVDALNFMFRNGWEVLHVKTSTKVQSYILKKRNDFVMNASIKSSNKNTAKSVEVNTTKVLKGKTKQVAKSNSLNAETNVKEKSLTLAKEAVMVPNVEVIRVQKKEVSTTKEKKQK